MSTLLQRVLARLSGLPSNVYDDEPLGQDFWMSDTGTAFRPRGKEFRIINEDGEIFLEIQCHEAWVRAQEYDRGYDMYGKLNRAKWGPLSGRRSADAVRWYSVVGCGLCGKEYQPRREVVLLSSANQQT